jgi:hypothetical protein
VPRTIPVCCTSPAGGLRVTKVHAHWYLKPERPAALLRVQVWVPPIFPSAAALPSQLSTCCLYCAHKSSALPRAISHQRSIGTMMSQAIRPPVRHAAAVNLYPILRPRPRAPAPPRAILPILPTSLEGRARDVGRNQFGVGCVTCCIPVF